MMISFWKLTFLVSVVGVVDETQSFFKKFSKLKLKVYCFYFLIWAHWLTCGVELTWGPDIKSFIPSMIWAKDVIKLTTKYHWCVRNHMFLLFYVVAAFYISFWFIHNTRNLWRSIEFELLNQGYTLFWNNCVWVYVLLLGRRCQNI